MRITEFTDFALRMLIQIGLQTPAPVRVQDIATAYGISYHHLTKVAQHLVQGGFLKSVRGRSGGMILAKPAKSINLADVLRHCESSTHLVECAAKTGNTCIITPACTLKTVLHAAESAFFSVMASYSLADITGNRDELLKLLRIAQPVDAGQRAII